MSRIAHKAWIMSGQQPPKPHSSESNEQINLTNKKKPICHTLVSPWTDDDAMMMMMMIICKWNYTLCQPIIKLNTWHASFIASVAVVMHFESNETLSNMKCSGFLPHAVSLCRQMSMRTTIIQKARHWINIRSMTIPFRMPECQQPTKPTIFYRQIGRHGIFHAMLLHNNSMNRFSQLHIIHIYYRVPVNNIVYAFHMYWFYDCRVILCSVPPSPSPMIKWTWWLTEADSMDFNFMKLTRKHVLVHCTETIKSEETVWVLESGRWQSVDTRLSGEWVVRKIT